MPEPCVRKTGGGGRRRRETGREKKEKEREREREWRKVELENDRRETIFPEDWGAYSLAGSRPGVLLPTFGSYHLPGRVTTTDVPVAWLTDWLTDWLDATCSYICQVFRPTFLTGGQRTMIVGREARKRSIPRFGGGGHTHRLWWTGWISGTRNVTTCWKGYNRLIVSVDERERERKERERVVNGNWKRWLKTCWSLREISVYNNQEGKSKEREEKWDCNEMKNYYRLGIYICANISN